MKTVRVAVIDDGIFIENIDSPVISYAVDEGRICEDDLHGIIPDSHGTICARIIEKYSQANIEFISLRVLNSVGRGPIDNLITALKWCAENEVDYINLSNGISQSNKLDELFEVCHKLHKNKKVIVAAQNNSKTCTYPADFPFVISVEQSSLFKPSSLMQSNIYANGSHKIKLGDKSLLTEKCNSYACAYVLAKIISGKAYRMNYRLSTNAVQWLSEKIRIEDLEEQLKCQPDEETKYNIIVNQDSCLESLKKYKDHIHSIIYLGSMPESLKRFSEKNGIFYWGFENFKFSVQHFFPFPIININYHNLSSARDFINRLEYLFTQDEFSVTKVSDNPELVLDGFFYLNSNTPNVDLSKIESYKHPDLVLSLLDSGRNKNFEADINILVESETEFIVCFDHVKQKVHTVQEIYNLLIKLLTN